MNMKNSKEVLSSILKTTQMGQIGIRAVQDMAVRTDMKQALSDIAGMSFGVGRFKMLFLVKTNVD